MSARRTAPAHGAAGRPSADGERIRDLADVPSFPAIYAAALDPRGARRGGGEPRLPEIAYRVRAVRIDGERARDFDHLMGGAATDLVHPGVLHVLAFPVSLALMARRDFPFRLLGLVHLRNQVLQHRPVRVGELVDVECRVRDLRPHRRGRTFEAVSTILGQDGEIVATDVSTYLVRGGGGADSGAGAAADPRSGADGTAPPREEAAPVREEFAPPRPTGRWRLGADTGRRYAAVSGDVNPVHLSALSARAFGFPSAIAHGMYTASRAFTEARVDLSRPLRWDVSFDAPVTLPGSLLVAFEDDPATGTVCCVGWRPGRGEKGPRRCLEVEVTTLER
ncbi:MaoC/PaaZ C-terminal domain-containing protein [Brachybacterium sp. J144]|uniref:MaoC/PaaZ C-terminal domain-containing protein n=1 Tax=Brachybacterium sp. J144 TaxID=3116487 RepID=UPI002E761235|nr:MaoC/PaaZ C-terminal domain-containing protein [Brachybacterium sp. J144]MEE1651953.1 MaoC/PaaZ C-terminal domain-containing protein [Brachybacterium sp. J144]